MKPTHRVTHPYQSAYPIPVLLRQGEILTTSSRETDWPGWIWCTTASGDSRWVPDVYIEEMDGQTVMCCDYNPVELTVQPGERLAAQEQVNGWAWCTNQSGQQGWVPLDCLEILREGK